MPKVCIKLHTFNGEDYWMFVRGPFSGVPIGDGEGNAEEFTSRYKIMARESIEDISCLCARQYPPYNLNC